MSIPVMAGARPFTKHVRGRGVEQFYDGHIVCNQGLGGAVGAELLSFPSSYVSNLSRAQGALLDV